MTVVTAGRFEALLARGVLRLRLGPFRVRIGADAPGLAEPLQQLYGAYPAADELPFDDYRIAVLRQRGVRRWLKPQVVFVADGETVPFEPFPADTALPLLEWGLNWCVATRAHQYLLLHAGVLEKNGRALLLPAWPGSGKSTLSTALMFRGWRLLSDEFALLRPDDGLVDPFPRPIPLKNASIPVIRAFAPEAVIGPVFPKTRKGDVAHVRPSDDSVARQHQAVRPAWIVYPSFQAGARVQLTPLARERSLLKLAGNSFNYERSGLRGFEAVARLMDTTRSWLFEYGDLDQAVARLDELAADEPREAEPTLTAFAEA